MIYEGSVRVDFTGGTLDLRPINLIIPQVVTVNMATNLKARVEILPSDQKTLELISTDYQKKINCSWSDLSSLDGEMAFMAKIMNYFSPRLEKKFFKIKLSSDAPPGSGLGGSSSLGVVLYKALCLHFELDFKPDEAIRIVNEVESIILNRGPAGYQDYYPALYGGMLALKPSPGKIEVEQLYKQSFSEELLKHLTLVYGNISRNSGINNWEVYKAFFDGDLETRKGLEKIASLSHETYSAIKSRDISGTLDGIAREGAFRTKLFKGILPPEFSSLYRDLLKDFPSLGLKVCGAGGGGCFLLIHDPDQRGAIAEKVALHQMRVLPLSINPPIDDFSP